MDRLVVPELRDFWTADGAIYFMRDRKPYFAFTREKQNPLLKNLDKANKKLLKTRNYRVPSDDLESALADPATEVFDLDRLNLINHSPNFRPQEYFYLEAPTNPKTYSLEDDLRRLVERVYGKGDDFYKVMAMLADGNLLTPRVYVLNPSYVRKHASASAIGRASWLSDFDLISGFNADVRGVDGHLALRGVVSSEPAGES